MARITSIQRIIRSIKHKFSGSRGQSVQFAVQHGSHINTIRGRIADGAGGQGDQAGARGGPGSPPKTSWLTERFQENGDTVVDATVRTMIGTRLLVETPGCDTGILDLSNPPKCSRQPDGHEIICGHRLDDKGRHDAICKLGGYVDARHDRVRGWLAKEIRIHRENGGEVGGVHGPAADPNGGKDGHRVQGCKGGC